MTDNEIIKALEKVKGHQIVTGNVCVETNTFDYVTVAQLIEIYNQQQEEIERLKEDRKRLKKVQMQLDDLCIMHRTIRVEAIKEFAKKLCADRVSNDPIVIAVKTELKEMVRK